MVCFGAVAVAKPPVVPKSSFTDLEKVLAPAKSIDRLLQFSYFRKKYAAAVDRYYGTTSLGCESYDSVLTQLQDLTRSVPWMAQRLWEPLRDAPDYAIKFGHESFRFRPVARRIHAIWAYQAPGCEPEACDPERAMKPRAPATAWLGRWAAGAKDAQIFLVEKNGSFTGTALLLSLYERDGGQWALITAYGARGVTRPLGADALWGTVPVEALKRWIEQVDRTRPARLRGYLFADDGVTGEKIASFSTSGRNAPIERHAEDPITRAAVDHVSAVCRGEVRKVRGAPSDEKDKKLAIDTGSTSQPPGAVAGAPLVVAAGPKTNEIEIEIEIPGSGSRAPLMTVPEKDPQGSDSGLLAIGPGVAGEKITAKPNELAPDLSIGGGDLVSFSEGSLEKDDTSSPFYGIARGLNRSPSSISTPGLEKSYSGLATTDFSGGIGGSTHSRSDGLGSFGGPSYGPGASNPRGRQAGLSRGMNGGVLPPGGALPPPGVTPPGTPPAPPPGAGVPPTVPPPTVVPPGSAGLDRPGPGSPPPETPPGRPSPGEPPGNTPNPGSPPPSSRPGETPSAEQAAEDARRIGAEIRRRLDQRREVPLEMLQSFMSLTALNPLTEDRNSAMKILTDAHFRNVSRDAARAFIQTPGLPRQQADIINELAMRVQEFALDCNNQQGRPER